MASSKLNEVAAAPFCTENGTKQARILCGCISRHWEFLWLVFSGIVICYTLRVNMSVAATAMMNELSWTETQRGSVLSSFYWGYSLGQIPASYMMMRGTFSPKWTFGFAVFIPSILTLLVPLCARNSYQMALAIRMLIGFVESATFPACYQFYVVWIPPADKTFMIATMLSGTFMGEIVGFSLSGGLVDSRITVGSSDFGGWPAVFYLFGLMGVIWFPFWVVYAYENPDVHPGISAEELAYIKGFAKHTNCTDSLRGVTGGAGDALPLGGIAEAAIGRAYSRASTDGKVPYHFSSDRTDNSNEQLTSVDILQTHGVGVQSTLTKKLLADRGNPLHDKAAAPTEESKLLDDDADKEGAAHVRTMEINRNSDYGGWSTSGSGGDVKGNANKDNHINQAPVEEAVEFSRIPWKHILAHPGFWNLLFSSWCVGFVQFMLLSEMPFYLTDELGFSASTAGVLSTVPFGFMFIMAIGTGNFLTSMNKRRGWTVKQMRLCAQALGLGGPSVFMLAIAIIPMDKWGKYVCIVFATMLIGANQAGISCAYSEFAPKFSPFINTISNALGAVAGIVGPVMISALLTANKSSGWEETFIICAIMCTSAVVVWHFYAVSEPVYLCNKMLPKIEM